jgi:peptidoglycan/LPS O-acetylase OafA/YrhL
MTPTLAPGKLVHAFHVTASPPDGVDDLENSVPALSRKSEKQVLSPPRPAPPPPPSGEKLEALTSLRFFAVVVVFLSHASGYIGAVDPSAKGLFLSVLGEGSAGVSFFFTLSGFILCYCYYEKFKDVFDDRSLRRSEAISACASQYKKYFVARVARIYPLHVFGLLFAAVLIRAGLLPFPLGEQYAEDVKKLRVKGFVAHLLLFRVRVRVRVRLG